MLGGLFKDAVACNHPCFCKYSFTHTPLSNSNKIIDSQGQTLEGVLLWLVFISLSVVMFVHVSPGKYTQCKLNNFFEIGSHVIQDSLKLTAYDFEYLTFQTPSLKC